ncbi:MAG: MBL fold metallo-hydrolase [Bacteroidales bacterium]|nr:MBL fold metallo-hydrolase [Bacteroidales bacterium]
MTEICALASGSNGNCYYIGNENEAVLIDIGIYYKRLIERLDDAGLDKNKIKAIFISHEHTDHIQGARSTSNKLGIPVFYTKKTYHKSYNKNKAQNFSFFEPGTPYETGNIKIHSFSKQHDAIDPCSFRVEIGNKNIGIMTDIGEADETLQNEFSKCDAVFLESNYDEDMLQTGLYPYHLKQRVSSSKGHLSNMQAIELVEQFASPQLKIIFLSHISAVNNTRELALETFSHLKNKYEILLTSRQEISEVVSL